MDKTNENKDDLKKPFSDYLVKHVAEIAPSAGNRNAELMSDPAPQEQQEGVSVKNAIKGKWKQHIGSARIAWGELTDDELLQTQGHLQKLTGLIQERYAITLDEAEKQVKGFIDTHKL